MQVMQMMVVITMVAWHNCHPLDFQGKETAKGKHLANVETKACRYSHKCLLMFWGCHGSQCITMACNCKYAMMTMMMKIMLTVMLMIMIMSVLQHDNDHDHTHFTA